MTVIPAEILARNVMQVRERVARACEAHGRDPASVDILPVTKNHPAEAVAMLVREGFAAVGENRVQEAVAKREALPNDAVAWELIGHLQSNKSKVAVHTFARIQSVDSVKLVHKLAAAASQAEQSVRILLQVNAGADPAKFGLPLDEVEPAVEAVLNAPQITCEGWMTIAPLTDDEQVARTCFSNLRAVCDRMNAAYNLAWRELSMGMSDDLEWAIAEGSTQVRVGSAFFRAE